MAAPLGERGAVRFPAVFAAELRRTAARRKAVGPPAAPIPEGARAGPSVEHGLVGLALSGGGIRSATFNLGLLQALGRKDALRKVDYLSTVSGGGYVGSCLTSLLSDPQTGVAPENFPFRFDGQTEREEIQHLRRHREYLAPRHGFFRSDTWRLVSAYAYGLGVSLVTMVALLAFASALGIALYPRIFGAVESALGPGELWQHPADHVGALYAPFVIGMIAWLGSAFLLGFGRAGAAGQAVRRLVGRWQGFCLGASVFLGALGSLALVFPLIRDAGDAFLDGTTFLGLLGLAALALPKLGAVAEAARSLPARLRRFAVLAGAWAFVGLLSFGVLYGVWSVWEDAPVVAEASFYCVTFLAFATGANDFSMFFFYRDRLSEAYVVVRKGGRLRGNDALRLADAVSETGPLHLVNTTVNLPGSDELALRGRRADLFLLSPLHCGSGATGYRATAEYDAGRTTLADAMAISGAATNPQYGPSTSRPLTFLMGLLNVRLGAWMPNPAFRTPAWWKWPLVRQVLRFWPWYVVKELFGLVDVRSRLVNLSDGGHIENLGVYALLERRCRTILCSDAGADPDRKFADLGNVLRMARIDLGVQIDIRTEPLVPGPDGCSGLHAVSGRILSPPLDGKEEIGTFLYVKSALVKADPQDLHAYRAESPSFPDESTADQFFSEAQFESYRELGYRAGKELLALAAGGGGK